MNVNLEKDTGSAAHVDHGPHLPTVVWGLTLVAVAVLVILREVTDVRIDVGLVVPIGMVVMGGLLVASALVGLLKGRRTTV